VVRILFGGQKYTSETALVWKNGFIPQLMALLWQQFRKNPHFKAEEKHQNQR